MARLAPALGKLPPEILILILDHLAELYREEYLVADGVCTRCLSRDMCRNLICLCLTSKPIRVWSEQLLYRNIRLFENLCSHKGVYDSWIPVEATPRMNRHSLCVRHVVALVKTLTRRPELRTAVRLANFSGWQGIYELSTVEMLDLVRKVETWLPPNSGFQRLSANHVATWRGLPTNYERVACVVTYLTGLLPLVLPKLQTWEFDDYPLPDDWIPEDDSPADTESENRITDWYSSVFSSSASPFLGISERLGSIETRDDAISLARLLRAPLPQVTTLTVNDASSLVASTIAAHKQHLPNVTHLRLHNLSGGLMWTTEMLDLLGPAGFTNLTSFQLICQYNYPNIYLDSIHLRPLPLPLLANNSPNLKHLVLDANPFEYCCLSNPDSMFSKFRNLEVLIMGRANWRTSEPPSFPPSLRILHLVEEAADRGAYHESEQRGLWNRTASWLQCIYESVKDGAYTSLREVHVELKPDFFIFTPGKFELLKARGTRKLDARAVEWPADVAHRECRKRFLVKMHELRTQFLTVGILLVVRPACTARDQESMRILDPRQKWLPRDMTNLSLGDGRW
ncbi:hypothetical protein B0T16DRAFT_442534 [Cercophora newfieldiana]|uniref:Uncharacterized protein n=1 Tax=Cercophora newfieldiana TaxID=92897 RepID=A0AA39YV09_9PEZI|nr:hypothetical protein B0T16DRAFT_442534 [Cercophora newfieldiana]